MHLIFLSHSSLFTFSLTPSCKSATMSRELACQQAIQAANVHRLLHKPYWGSESGFEDLHSVEDLDHRLSSQCRTRTRSNKQACSQSGLMHSEHSSLTYGEGQLADISATFAALDQIALISQDSCLCEIGSGFGTVVVYAAVRFKCPILAIELHPMRHFLTQRLIRDSPKDSIIHIHQHLITHLLGNFTAPPFAHHFNKVTHAFSFDARFSANDQQALIELISSMPRLKCFASCINPHKVQKYWIRDSLRQAVLRAQLPFHLALASTNSSLQMYIYQVEC